MSTETAVLRINDRDIRYRRDGMISMTEVWTAFGSPQGKEPLEWVRDAGSAFVDSIAKTYKLEPCVVVATETGGVGQEVVARWEVCLFYGYDIGQGVRLWVSDDCDGKADSQGLPGLSMERAIDVFEIWCGDDLRLVDPPDISNGTDGPASSAVDPHDELGLFDDVIGVAPRVPFEEILGRLSEGLADSSGIV